MKTKELIRKEFLAKRLVLSKSKVEDYSKKVSENVFSILPEESKNIFIFLSIEEKNELQTSYIIDRLKKSANKNIFVPKTISKNQMEACLYDSETDLELNKWKIPEPKECKKTNAFDLDVVFLPLLAVNKLGYRVGYGGGFYDRYLTQCNPNCLKIGLGIFDPISDINWQDDFDIALDFYVTPEKIYLFG